MNLTWNSTSNFTSSNFANLHQKYYNMVTENIFYKYDSYKLLWFPYQLRNNMQINLLLLTHIFHLNLMENEYLNKFSDCTRESFRLIHTYSGSELSTSYDCHGFWHSFTNKTTTVTHHDMPVTSASGDIAPRYNDRLRAQYKLQILL